MGLYRECILPFMLHFGMRGGLFDRYRTQAASGTKGRVLEIGCGSGLNLPFYPRSVESVYGLEPEHRALRLAQRMSAETVLQPVEGLAETLPFPNASFEAVVSTWTLCTVRDPDKALAEIKRVLRPGGHFAFVEHGLAADSGIRRIQNTLNPLQNVMCGGCNLNRPIDRLIAGAGFTIDGLSMRYEGFPKFATFMYAGRAYAN